MITRESASADYDFLKKNAFIAFSKGNFEECLFYVETACKIAYHLNFRFSDYDFEDLLNDLSKKICHAGVLPLNHKSDRYIFYDCFAIDNRGLTQQYIRALISWDVEFLFVLESDETIHLSEQILCELKGYDKATILIVPKSMTKVEKIQFLTEKVTEYAPLKAFLHLSPSDVVGVTLWNHFTSITRYQINLTDHAFWIGVNCCDYILEFRNYGYNLSISHRGIPRTKLLMMPYYPIESVSAFQGLGGQETDGYIKLFSGGSFYKIYGENGVFFSMIQEVLNRNKNTILYFAGDGVRGPFKRFIKINKLENRVVLLGNRKDISEIFRNIDVYIGTYPFCGGLMSQFAGLCAKPIISYSDKKLQVNDIEELFPKLRPDVQLTYKDFDLFFAEVDRLIQDKNYREQRGRELNLGGITPEVFNSQLRDLVSLNMPENDILHYEIDVDTFSNLYFETENKFLNSYESAFSLTFLKLVFYSHPVFSSRIFVRKCLKKLMKTIGF